MSGPEFRAPGMAAAPLVYRPAPVTALQTNRAASAPASQALRRLTQEPITPIELPPLASLYLAQTTRTTRNTTDLQAQPGGQREVAPTFAVRPETQISGNGRDLPSYLENEPNDSRGRLSLEETIDRPTFAGSQIHTEPLKRRASLQAPVQISEQYGD
jgi:hypothetical protein